MAYVKLVSRDFRNFYLEDVHLVVITIMHVLNLTFVYICN